MGALNIKNPKVADMARRLAKLKNKSITEAVAEAIAEGLKNASADNAAAQTAREREVDEIVKRFQASLPPDAPSPWKVMEEMYDEYGLPK